MESPPSVSTRTVRYHADAAALLAALANHGLVATQNGHPVDTVLLDSADIASRDQLTTIMMIDANVRLTCNGSQVNVEALPGSDDDGLAGLSRLRERLGDCVTSRTGTTLTLTIPDTVADQGLEERERLQTRSSLEPLRILAGAEQDHPHLPLLLGVFAFDYLASFEQLPEVPEGPNTCPDYVFYDARIILVLDHPTQHATLVGASVNNGALRDRLDELTVFINGFTDQDQPVGEVLPSTPKEIHAYPTVSDEDFQALVERMREYIAAGDIYQVVPSRGFMMDCPNALLAYQHLRLVNPSPYMFYVATPEFELAGASPESSLLYSVVRDEITIRPIAGTKPRGLNPDGSINYEQDTRHELELRTDAKEIAEHIMLVDLARNDVARVCVPGTRRVTDLMRVDRYSRVMHLVSEVSGKLSPDLDALDAFRASMTMGTLTGAPKVRAAELIREVEGVRRGSYGGAVGYIRGDGEFDTCIVIRSAFVRDGTALVQAGAGVVHSSDPEAEAAETVHKARAVLEAIAASQGAQVVIHTEGEH